MATFAKITISVQVPKDRHAAMTDADIEALIEQIDPVIDQIEIAAEGFKAFGLSVEVDR